MGHRELFFKNRIINFAKLISRPLGLIQVLGKGREGDLFREGYLPGLPYT